MKAEYINPFVDAENTAHVIMVTTEAEKARVIEAIRAGVNDYLMKPFTPEKLAEKIKQAVPGGT